MFYQELNLGSQKKKFDVVMAAIHYIGKDKVGVHWLNRTFEYDKALLKDYTNEIIFQEYYEEYFRLLNWVVFRKQIVDFESTLRCTIKIS